MRGSTSVSLTRLLSTPFVFADRSRIRELAREAPWIKDIFRLTAAEALEHYGDRMEAFVATHLPQQQQHQQRDAESDLETGGAKHKKAVEPGALGETAAAKIARIPLHKLPQRRSKLRPRDGFILVE